MSRLLTTQAQRQRLLLLLCLAAFGVFLLSGSVALVVLRLASPGMSQAAPIVLPPVLWLSTMIMLATSVTFERSLWLVKRERQHEFCVWLSVSAGLVAGFMVLQALGLWDLLARHFAVGMLRRESQGLVAALVFFHALHVLGGMVPLGIVLSRARKGRYDHECYGGVESCALYFHFLDGVWLILMLTFAWTR